MPNRLIAQAGKPSYHGCLQPAVEVGARVAFERGEGGLGGVSNRTLLCSVRQQAHVRLRTASVTFGVNEGEGDAEMDVEGEGQDESGEHDGDAVNVIQGKLAPGACIFVAAVAIV